MLLLVVVVVVVVVDLITVVVIVAVVDVVGRLWPIAPIGSNAQLDVKKSCRWPALTFSLLMHFRCVGLSSAVLSLHLSISISL